MSVVLARLGAGIDRGGFLLGSGRSSAGRLHWPVGHRRRVRQGDGGQSRATRARRLRQAVQGGKETRCRHRERHARVAATLLAHQRQHGHVLLQRLVRRLQARHREQEFLHGLLVGRGIALCVYVRGQSLLVI